MLPSRGLLRSSPSLGLARVRSLQTPRTSLPLSARQFGTALRANTTGRLGAPYSPLKSTRIGGTLAIAASSQSLFSSRRYASTESAAAPAASQFVGADLPGAVDISTPVGLTGSDLLNMPETIGFLKAYGLDYGWGVTAMMEWYVEHIYVYTGLPWWATISIAAVGLRLAIVKPSLDAQKQQQKTMDLRKDPHYSQLEAKYKAVVSSGAGLAAGMPLQQEMSMMRKAAGVKLWKTMIPMINIPISFGMFRLCRGMAGLPVPSLETGGALWFQDLSVADPFFILPVITAAVVWKGLQVAIPYMPPAQQKTMKLMGLVLMPLSLIFTIKLSAATQLYFLVTASLHTLQSAIFYQPWFRNMMGLGAVPTAGTAPVAQVNNVWQAPRGTVIDTKAKTVPTATDESYFSTIKESISSAKTSVTSTISERGESSEKKNAAAKAREYEEKRALEEKEKLIARREYKQMRRRQR